MDREELLDSLTGNEPAAEPTPAEAPQPEAAPAPEPEQQDEREAAPSETAAFLDSLTEGGDAKKPEEPAPEADSGKPTADQSATETPKTEQPAAEKTLDEQEAEALEGVKSERGQARIKETFARLRETEQQKQQYENDINEFRELVKSTGMAPDEFAQTLEYGRLRNSGSEDDKRLALQMLDQQRALLAQELGVEVPGVDPLADFPDLKADVENMGITKERALEVAKYRRAQAVQQQAQQQQQATEREQQEWNQRISTVSQTAQAYFATREKEADYPMKMAQIATKFKDPAFMQEFVATYQPEQWFSAMKMMYDAIVVPAAPRAPSQQPIRSRPQLAGTPQVAPSLDMTERLARHIDSL